MNRALPCLLSLAALTLVQAQTVPSPSDFLKLKVGADRTLADYTQISAYLKELARTSPRVQVENLGKTTLDRDMLMAVISSPENLKQKARYQAIARKLADPRGRSSSELDALVKEGKTIVLVTCGIHASEIGASQMSLEWAHTLATAQDTETKRRLDNVILLLVPSLNPDGHDMEVDWYRKQLGTPFEGGRMPWLYHWYVGHDTNRDWIALTQKESLAMNRAVYHTWNPQIWLDEHQMGSTGARIFIPPYSNPVSPNLNPILWRQVDHIGSMMAWRMEQKGQSGVGYGFAFDAYWPGGTKNTAWFKNTAGLLSEAASCRLATPIEVHPSELTGNGKGLIEYKQQTNFPNHWKGGTWRLRDIMDYERTLSDALLEVAADRREDFLKARIQMTQDSLALGTPERLWRIPARQHDGPTALKLVHLLQEHAVEVLWNEGDQAWYVPSHQPFGLFVKEVFSLVRYPEVRVQPGGPILEPYDITTWNLPLHMGVEVKETTLDAQARRTLRPVKPADGPIAGLEGSGSLYVLGRDSNAATPLLNAYLKAGGRAQVATQAFEAKGRSFPAGSLLLQPTPGLEALAKAHRLLLPALASSPSVPLKTQKAVRVGLYKSFQASMDEGWTRFVLDQAQFKPTSLDNKAMKAGNLKDNFDVLIFANQGKEAIVEGRARREGVRTPDDFPADYMGGIGKEGLKAVRDFVEAGGTLVCLGASGDLAIDELALPARSLAAGQDPGFSAPGILVNLQVDPTHPVTWGMPKEAVGFLSGKAALQTTPPRGTMTRTVLASYPGDERDILASGYLKGGDRLAQKTGAAAFEVGKGKVVLFAFGVQHRAQTDGTFKMLFNALNWGGLEPSQPGR